MEQELSRRHFLRNASLGIAAVGLANNSFAEMIMPPAGTRVGIIGLDTSHSVAFAKALNNPVAGPEFLGYRVVAAYPFGSRDIKSSSDRISGYTDDVKKIGVEITDSITDLLSKVDVVLLETNDGRPHREQAMQVIGARKPLFIDKPVAATLQDVQAIYKAAAQARVPVFSSSSLRYATGAQEIAGGKIGKVLGADTYSPCTLEPAHPDLYWYGIHGVEMLFTVMGTGCSEVRRVRTQDTEIVVGTWTDGRIGTFRGTRSGKHIYGGTAFGEKGAASLGEYNGYNPLLLKIVEFFKTGVAPVSPAETLEIYAFMTAADISKQKNGAAVTLASVI